ncbi:MAG: rRNA maturation RNase YbeY [Sulfuriflexus sp.]|nr:rRNA maturation RNase YbeY [Sulfuriflexus sp.]
MIELQLQVASQSAQLPDEETMQAWLNQIGVDIGDASVGIRIVDLDESAELNNQYRHKQGATNVLSFPFELPTLPDDLGEAEVSLEHFLGDLVICAPIVEDEAKAQDKALNAHWAHMIVHGVLHLQGHDHIEQAEAEQMETLERTILANLGFPDPYLET